MKGPLQSVLSLSILGYCRKHGGTTWWTGRGPAPLVDIKSLILNNKKTQRFFVSGDHYYTSMKK